MFLFSSLLVVILLQLEFRVHGFQLQKFNPVHFDGLALNAVSAYSIIHTSLSIIF